jgi:hypothetical protein
MFKMKVGLREFMKTQEIPKTGLRKTGLFSMKMHEIGTISSVFRAESTLIPYGSGHTSPELTNEPLPDSP